MVFPHCLSPGAAKYSSAKPHNLLRFCKIGVVTFASQLQKNVRLFDFSLSSAINYPRAEVVIDLYSGKFRTFEIIASSKTAASTFSSGPTGASPAALQTKMSGFPTWD